MDLQKLAQLIRTNRINTGLPSAVAAKELRKAPSYYSRLENGKERPSQQLIQTIGVTYGMAEEDVKLMLKLAGYDTSSISKSENTVKTNNKAEEINVKIDPIQNKILFSDGMYISVSDNGVVFDFGQKVGPVNEQVIVARIGVSYKHAEKIHKLLGQQLKNAKEMGIEN